MFCTIVYTGPGECLACGSPLGDGITGSVKKEKPRVLTAKHITPEGDFCTMCCQIHRAPAPPEEDDDGF